MKIAQVIHADIEFPPSGWGGTERVIWNSKINLEKLGHQCELVWLNNLNPNEYDIVHLHVANIAIEAAKRNIKYVFSCHDHHPLITKFGFTNQQVNEAARFSDLTLVASETLKNVFTHDNVKILRYGVDPNLYYNIHKTKTEHKLLCVAHNGIIFHNYYDRKGFGHAIELAKEFNLPITIIGPSGNKAFFENCPIKYDKLEVKYDLNNEKLIEEYNNHSVFLHFSEYEAGHPNLTLLEAMSCGLPVLALIEKEANLPGLIKSEKNIIESREKLGKIFKHYNYYSNLAINTARNNSWLNYAKKLVSIYEEIKMKKELIQIYNSTKINIKENKRDFNNYECTFLPHPKIQILGEEPRNYEVSFIDKRNYLPAFKTKISTNMWCACSREYYNDWLIKIEDEAGNLLEKFELELKGKKVQIINESPSIGDTIAWVPYIQEFQKKHQCFVDFYTPYKELFEEKYKHVKFFNYFEKDNDGYYIKYSIGYFKPEQTDRIPQDSRTLGLQEVVCEILGLEYKEIKTEISFPKRQNNIGKYVCFSTTSTSGCKEWQNQNGWSEAAEYLQKLGYKIVLIQKDSPRSEIKGAIFPRTETLQEAAAWIDNCEFFIGLGSGMSWLAWALGKKVILISGFSKEFAEFNTPYRVINKNVCHGCWNDTDHKFDPGDWNWCPKLKGTERQFECSKEISFEMVRQKIDQCIIDLASNNSS